MNARAFVSYSTSWLHLDIPLVLFLLILILIPLLHKRQMLLKDLADLPSELIIFFSIVMCDGISFENL